MGQRDGDGGGEGGAGTIGTTSGIWATASTVTLRRRDDRVTSCMTGESAALISFASASVGRVMRASTRTLAAETRRMMSDAVMEMSGARLATMLTRWALYALTSKVSIVAAITVVKLTPKAVEGGGEDVTGEDAGRDGGGPEGLVLPRMTIVAAMAAAHSVRSVHKHRAQRHPRRLETLLRGRDSDLTSMPENDSILELEVDLEDHSSLNPTSWTAVGARIGGARVVEARTLVSWSSSPRLE